MKSFVDDIATYLGTQGLGSLTTGTPTIFADRYPATPANIVAVLNTPGNQTPSKDVAALQYPSFQVVVRHADYDTAADNLASVRAALHGKIGLTLANHYALRIHARTEGGCLGQDTEGLWEFSITFDAEAR